MQPPVEIQTRSVDRAKLGLKDADPVKLGKIEWRVVTRENAAEVFQELERQNIDPVLFALTDNGYEVLSTDLAKLRAWAIQQREITQKYREYYEGDK